MRDDRYTTHPRAVAGIMLMASLMLFVVLFFAIIAIAAYISPLNAQETSVYVSPVLLWDYFSAIRILIAASISSVAVGLFWYVAPD